MKRFHTRLAALERLEAQADAKHEHNPTGEIDALDTTDT